MSLGYIDVTTHDHGHRRDCPVAVAKKAHYESMKAQGLVEEIPYEDDEGTYESYPPFQATEELRAQCKCPSNAFRKKNSVILPHQPQYLPVELL